MPGAPRPPGAIQTVSLQLGCARLTGEIVARPGRALHRRTLLRIATFLCAEAFAHVALCLQPALPAPPRSALVELSRPSARSRRRSAMALPRRPRRRTWWCRCATSCARLARLSLHTAARYRGCHPHAPMCFRRPSPRSSRSPIADGFTSFRHSLFNLRFGLAAEALTVGCARATLHRERATQTRPSSHIPQFYRIVSACSRHRHRKTPAAPRNNPSAWATRPACRSCAAQWDTPAPRPPAFAR